MPGTVIRVARRAGRRGRARGSRCVVLEAMKMETPLVVALRRHGRAAVHVAEGDRVAGGALLVELEE